MADQRLATEALAYLVMLGALQLAQNFKVEKQDTDKLCDWSLKTVERVSPAELNDPQKCMAALFDALALMDNLLEGGTNE